MAALNPFRVGMIGYGLSAKIFHIPYIQAIPSFKLQAICQRNPSNDDDAAKDHPDVTIHRTPEELIKDSEVDVVIIGTPPVTHLTLTKQALEAGKHVVVEKPFCPTAAECDELIKCAKDNDKVLTVFQNRRWDTDFLTLVELLRHESLGRIVEFETHFDRWSPHAPQGWKGDQNPGQGVVYDLGSHLIDQVVNLFGMPKKITGFIHRQRQPPTDLEDSCTVLLHYNGMLAIVKASVMSLQLKQLRFKVRGDSGGYKKYHLDPQEPQLKAGMKLDHPHFGREPEEDYGILTVVDKDKEIVERRYPSLDPVTYLGFYKSLASALLGQSPVPVEAKDARDVIYLIELARKSAQEGRTLDVE
ncbi:NAD binding Rossmann fold oxidoreductase [Rhizodiscina lignyota]|uniref:NAD binding Rossmann fold oxidoreductase n=1 Tax=Rhizodiscina lignyota TaxID=1504668 RepID=A0A9P4M3J2_9PEZI|nr:NAD binding Rossmann fold oxidoreductase [Rhizodiscina lignyota]